MVSSKVSKLLKTNPLYASISGGKDSTAMALWFLEQGFSFKPVFLDTGWEHQETYDYIKQVLEPIFGKFIVVRNEKYFKDDPEWSGGMEQLIKSSKMFPSYRTRFCSRELKILPIQRFYNEQRFVDRAKPISAVGIRAQESKKRATMPEFEVQDEAYVWRPLIDWSEQDVVDIHHRHNVAPNPLYLRGHSRVGCFPCVFAGKREIRHFSLAYEDRIDRIRDLEARVAQLHDKPESKSSFFTNKYRPNFPIDEVVEWVRQDRNFTGDSDDLENIEDQGCLRWSLCDLPSAKSEARDRFTRKQLRFSFMEVGSSN